MTEAMIPAKEFEGELWIKASDHQLAIAIAVAHEREKVAQWQIGSGYSTGHGETIEDLLVELEWQVRESERESCAKVADEWVNAYQHPSKVIAETIRKRGQA